MFLQTIESFPISSCNSWGLSALSAGGVQALLRSEADCDAPLAIIQNHRASAHTPDMSQTRLFQVGADARKHEASPFSEPPCMCRDTRHGDVWVRSDATKLEQTAGEWIARIAQPPQARPEAVTTAASKAASRIVASAATASARGPSALSHMTRAVPPPFPTITEVWSHACTLGTVRVQNAIPLPQAMNACQPAFLPVSAGE